MSASVLGDFERLSDGIHLYVPETPLEPEAATANEPGLVIICAWMFAAPRHIVKYIRKYQGIYPLAKILLLQNNMSNMTWRPDRLQIIQMDPAVIVIKDFLNSRAPQREQGCESRPLVLLHVFSNGGAHSAVQLAQTYRERLSDRNDQEPLDLPISAMVLDSCPGKPDYHLAVKATTAGLPKNPLVRLIATPLLHGMLLLAGLSHQIGVAELATSKTWRVLNDPSGPFLQRQTPRTYVYSKGDVMIPAEDVVEHAEIARSASGLGDDRIALVEFIGSQHVNHLSVDAEKYWRVVQETWNRAVV